MRIVIQELIVSEAPTARVAFLRDELRATGHFENAPAGRVNSLHGEVEGLFLSYANPDVSGEFLE